jgi:Zn-dependent protease
LNITSLEQSAYFITVRGTISPSITPTPTYDKIIREINRRIAAVPSLETRLRVLVLPEYQNPSINNKLVDKYSGSEFEPVILVMNRAASPKPQGFLESFVILGTFLTSIITCLIFSTDANSMNPAFLAQALAGDDAIIGKVLPIVAGLLVQQMVHEIGHIAAASVHNLKLQLPVFLPSLQTGLYGAITRFLDFPKSRKALFDVSIAGPFLGYLAAIAAVYFGIMETSTASAETLASYPALPVGFFRTSFAFSYLLDNFLHITEVVRNLPNIDNPQAMTAVRSAVVAVHPAVVVGCIGLLTNAFNFLPIGRLDGGRVAMALTGRRAASLISFLSLLLQGIGLISDVSSATFVWVIVSTLLQRGQDLPPEDDVSPIASDADDQRKGAAWFGRLFALVLCTLVTTAVMLPAINSGTMDPASLLPQDSGINV